MMISGQSSHALIGEMVPSTCAATSEARCRLTFAVGRSAVSMTRSPPPPESPCASIAPSPSLVSPPFSFHLYPPWLATCEPLIFAELAKQYSSDCCHPEDQSAGRLRSINSLVLLTLAVNWRNAASILFFIYKETLLRLQSYRFNTPCSRKGPPATVHRHILGVYSC